MHPDKCHVLRSLLLPVSLFLVDVVSFLLSLPATPKSVFHFHFSMIDYQDRGSPCSTVRSLSCST
jgi:hypothetical protein